MSYGLTEATVRYGDVAALDHVSVPVRPGTIVSVVGGDGAGKTSLIRALVGEVQLQAGSVRAPTRERIGYLPASVGSWAALTVAQNLDFTGGTYGLSGDRLARRRAELLTSAGLAAASDRLASQLSGGMRRKLGFCMAMAHRPDLLVLDEPSTGVDPVSRVDLWRLVSTAAAAGAAVLMSTTYLDEAERASHLVVLDGGAVLVQGDLETVLAAPGGTVTEASAPTRRAWAWRRGRRFREFWPDGEPATGEAVKPDLEDVVIALSLLRRAKGATP